MLIQQQHDWEQNTVAAYNHTNVFVRKLLEQMSFCSYMRELNFTARQHALVLTYLAS